MSAPRFTVAFVGTGPNPETPVWGESAAMAYRHAAGYRAIDDCDLVACADLVSENAESFAEEFDIGSDGVYEDYTEMLSATEPDFVSVCTPVPTHADIVTDCIESGFVDAIHCEKPMADTWGGARRMASAADAHDVQLTFNHQRRCDPGWREAKRLLDDGAIGDLQRIEVGPRNLLDHGTHLFDMCAFFTDAQPIDWVIGQVDYRTENVRYGTHNVNQGIVQWAYADEETTAGTATDEGADTADEERVPLYGFAAIGAGRSLVDVGLRLRGTEGVIELHEGSTQNRLRRDGDAEWEAIDAGADSEIGGDLVADAIAHVVESFTAGKEPTLAASEALVATELIFATYESVRRCGRVDLPLETDDNALEALVEDGRLAPAPTE